MYLNDSVGAGEYAERISAEGYEPPTKECPKNDTKQSDDERSAVEL